METEIDQLIAGCGKTTAAILQLLKETGMRIGEVLRLRWIDVNFKNKKKIGLLPKTFPAFDLFEHKIVPKHEVLSEEEKAELLTKYKVRPYQLPQISSVDPTVKAIGAKPGDVLRIIRKSPTAGEHMAYRYVVE